MYKVTINVNHRLIGYGELTSIILDAIKAHIVGQAKETDDEPLVHVEYEKND